MQRRILPRLGGAQPLVEAAERGAHGAQQRTPFDELAEDIAEGLEPVRLTPGAVHWCSHYAWFRWFASGDVMLLGLLLFFGQLR